MVRARPSLGGRTLMAGFRNWPRADRAASKIRPLGKQGMIRTSHGLFLRSAFSPVKLLRAIKNVKLLAVGCLVIYSSAFLAVGFAQVSMTLCPLNRNIIGSVVVTFWGALAMARDRDANSYLCSMRTTRRLFVVPASPSQISRNDSCARNPIGRAAAPNCLTGV